MITPLRWKWGRAALNSHYVININSLVSEIIPNWRKIMIFYNKIKISSIFTLVFNIAHTLNVKTLENAYKIRQKLYFLTIKPSHMIEWGTFFVFFFKVSYLSYLFLLGCQQISGFLSLFLFFKFRDYSP